ncbi:hypothetical protein EON65_00835 [archaeon]|nr:MAG: hypothetical protein EON65_00835 [archaeon]
MEEVTFEGFTNLGQVASNTSHPIHRGLVRDWTLMEKMWENIRDTANLHDLDGTSVMLIESILTGATDNLKWAELLFETAKAPSICISSSPPLSVYASGRTCGLAVEFGAGLTSVVPVFEGFSLKHAVVTANFGGQDISASLKKLFGTKNVQIDLNSAKIVKEKLAFVKGFSSRDMHQTTHEQMTFCLPDGNDVTIETRIFRDCADPLFVPGKPSNTPNHVNYENIDIVSNIHESIVLCDESVRKDLSQNIIISGGTSLLPGRLIITVYKLSNNFMMDSNDIYIFITFLMLSLHMHFAHCCLIRSG